MTKAALRAAMSRATNTIMDTLLDVIADVKVKKSDGGIDTVKTSTKPKAKKASAKK
jgi:hypothetical protein